MYLYVQEATRDYEGKRVHPPTCRPIYPTLLTMGNRVKFNV